MGFENSLDLRVVAGSASNSDMVPLQLPLPTGNFRKDFLGACAPQPSSLAGQPSSLAGRLEDPQVSRILQLLAEARQTEEQRVEWQGEVGTELNKVADESAGLKTSLASIERQLSRMEALLHPSGGQVTGEAKWGRQQYASAQLDGDSRQRPVDLESSFQAIKAAVSETALHLETSFERRIMAMDEKVAQQLDFIHKTCSDLQEKEAHIDADQLENMIKGIVTPRTPMTHSPTLARMMATPSMAPMTATPTLGGLPKSPQIDDFPEGDPLALPVDTVEKVESGDDMPSQPPNASRFIGALERTSIMPTVSRRKLAGAVHLPEVSQCIFILDVVSFWLIIGYLVFVGLSLSFGMSNAKIGEKLPVWIKVGDWTFLVAFVVELAVRLSLEKSAFFLSSHVRWNALDVILTVIQVIDVLGLTFTKLSLARSLKIVKSLRAASILRHMKNLRSLRLILSIAVWRPLMWGVVSLIFLSYTFSLLFAQLVTDWFTVEGHNTADVDLLANLELYYGTLRHSMVSLFMAVTGGELWAVLLRPLQKISPWSEPLFVAYIILTTCGMVNILSALFVDMVLFTSNRDRDMQMTDREKQDRELVHGLKQLLQKHDRTKSGRVHRDVVMKVLSNKENKKALHELGMDMDNVKALFKLLDVQDRNRVGIDEFCYGMLNMSADSHFARDSMLMFQSKRTLDRLDLVAQVVGARLHKLEKLIVESFARARLGESADV